MTSGSEVCWRRRSRPALAALAGAGLVLAALAGCGSSGATTVRASASPLPVGASQLSGTWPAPTTTSTTTTTTTAPPAPVTAPAPAGRSVDPASGLSVSGPIGPPWPTSFTAADATAGQVALYQSPGVPVPGGRSLPNPTREGVPLVMLVRQDQGDWLQVQINTRPNGATAWVQRSQVSLRSVPNHVVIDLAARKVTVYHGDAPIWSASVAPGKASSPTPTGSFYVDVLAKPPNPNGPYGAYQISFTGFSNVYERFGSGNGQVAMHGTNEPALIGTPASHGCVRMSNPDITYLLGLAPQGTPVDVVG
jgi:lipoprotein-anchoring transpeptidase ErfK/SrfK